MKCYVKYFFILFFVLFLSFSTHSLAADTSSVSIQSPSAILVYAEDGQVLYEKDANEVCYPASTTKIMTAILTLESGHDLSELATVSQTAVDLVPAVYSSAYLQPGEQFTLEQLLKVLLIPSANDAANVLAEYVSGSVSTFSEKMNEKATALGCKNTHFVNPNGIHDENHYSTAYDLSLIARYAMQNETFREIVLETSCSLPATSFYPSPRTFTTTNYLLRRSSSYYYPYANGIKTGFTSAAGGCLIAGSNKDNLEFVAVLLGFNGNNRDDKFKDASALFEFAYQNYAIQSCVKKGDLIQTVVIENATEETKELSLYTDREITVFKDISEVPTIEIKINENLQAPIQKDDVVGSATYTIMGKPYEILLLAGSDVEKAFDPTLIFIIGIPSILLLVGVILFLKKRK